MIDDIYLNLKYKLEQTEEELQEYKHRYKVVSKLTIQYEDIISELELVIASLQAEILSLQKTKVSLN